MFIQVGEIILIISYKCINRFGNQSKWHKIIKAYHQQLITISDIHILGFQDLY